MRLSTSIVRLALVSFSLCTWSAVASDASIPPDSSSVNTLTWTFHAGEYRIVPTKDGQRIEMEGRGLLTVPGRPLLPSASITLALPPGARAESVSVESVESTALPGVYRIQPASSPIPLVDPARNQDELRDLRREWTRNRLAMYSTDRAYPAAICELVGTGSLRKYAYATVAVRPFTYHPRSGRLIRHENVRFTVHYRLPEPGTAAARHQAALTWDQAADDRASGLFVNRAQRRSFYASSRGSLIGPVPWGSDYLIITDAGFVEAITTSDFPAWKGSLGHGMKIVTTSDPRITGQPGPSLSQKIRSFLRDVYGPWGVEYVLLVGGVDTVPMHYCFPDPSNHTNRWWNPNDYGGAVPTDHYYADLSDPESAGWDSDGDGFCGEYGEDDPDFLTEVYVGRIPTSNPGQITYALDKLVAFEQDTGGWKDRVLHGGAILFFENQNYDGVPFICGCRSLAAIEDDLMSGMTITHYSEQAGIVTSPYPWAALTEGNFIGSWRSGQYGIVNWSGHGSPDGAWRIIWDWDDGDGVFETNGSDGLTVSPIVQDGSVLDDDHPSIVFAISCNVGYPEVTSYGNLGIDLLTKPGIGSSAGLVSASRPAAISADFAAYPGGAEGYAYEFNNQMITHGKPVGDAIYDAKWYVHTNYVFVHIYEFQNLFDYNLFGDPALVR